MAKDYYKLFEVDTSVDNIKTLREEIKLLKKELEKLTIGSEEYEKVSDQLWAKQSRFNEIIKESKRPLEDADGSFNSWLKTLKKLKDQWKATSDEMERARLGAEINAVKEKINDANESIGNFQHNVGNYTNSIVDAFSKMGISIGGPFTKMSSMFGLLTGGLGKVMEAFKKLWAVIVANPVTALIAALGVLIAYWDDLKDVLGSVKTAYDKVIDDTNEFTDALKDTQTEMNRTIKLMKAMGADEIAIAAYRTGTLNKQLAETTEKLEGQKAELANLERWWVRVGRAVLSVIKWIVPITEEMHEMFGLGGKVDGLKESIAKLEDEQKNLNEAVADANIDEYIAHIDADTKATKRNTAAKKDNADAKKELLEFDEILLAINKAEAENAERQYQEEEERFEKAKALRQEEIDARKTDLEREEESYLEKLELFKKFNLDTTELELNHLERMEQLRKEQAIREEEDFKKHKQNMDEDDEKSEKKFENLMQARIAATKGMVNSTSAILKNLSAAMGENTKLGKGFAIAAATIDTIAAAVAGFRAGFSQWENAGFMAWMAPVQAALNATMALTAGFAEVQKIRNVDTSGSNSGGGSTALAMAIPNIEGLSTPMDYTRQVVTDTEKEEMNQNNRVYILESDIQQSNNRVKVREEETTF